jgi:hypothetical protein
MFQQSLIFHAEVEYILYEWGNPSYGTMPSPDDTAQAQIARAFSDYAGKFGDTKSYQYGKMNDLLYPVNGGMGDWVETSTQKTPAAVSLGNDGNILNQKFWKWTCATKYSHHFTSDRNS